MKKLFTSVTVALGLAVGAQAQAAEWRMGMLTPPPYFWTQLSNQFAENVAKDSGNRHSIKIFPSAQLGNDAEMLRQMQQGSLDFMIITVAELANNVDELNALLAPGLVQSNEHAARLLGEGKKTREMLDVLEKKLGVKGLDYVMAGVNQYITSFDAKTLQDMKGQKVRITPAPATRDWNIAVGAAPLPIPLPAVYDSFANGQVNAVDLNMGVMQLLKLDQRGKTLLLSNNYMFPGVILVSSRLWRTLSDEDKKIIQENAQELGEKIRQQAVTTEAKAKEALTASGNVKVVEVPASQLAEPTERWEKTWAPKLPQLKELRKEAAALADK
jgi:TRAP-type C4-dicarboxylate transport system substrate-binding protein